MMYEVSLPCSKSALQREVFCAATIVRNRCKIAFSSLCDDSVTALRLASNFAEIAVFLRTEDSDFTGYTPENTEFIKLHSEITDAENSFIDLRPKGNILDPGRFNCGESGLALHLFAFVAAFRKLENAEIVIDGVGTILRRNMGGLIKALKICGFDVKSAGGKLPIEISGLPKISGNLIKLGEQDGSQVVSGLLLATYDYAGLEIQVDKPKSINYVAMTIQSLGKYGVTTENNNFCRYVNIKSAPVNSVYTSAENCWSSASFWFIAGAIKGNIKISGLRPDSLQPDRAIVRILSACGAKFLIDNDDNYVFNDASDLRSFNVNATNFPDLIPNLVILASFCIGESRISGIKRLKNKESDRASVILTEFCKIGITVHLLDKDTFAVTGKTQIRSATIKSHGDHRIVIAAKLAELISGVAVFTDSSECVAKSWNGFFSCLNNYINSKNELYGTK